MRSPARSLRLRARLEDGTMRVVAPGRSVRPTRQDERSRDGRRLDRADRGELPAGRSRPNTQRSRMAPPAAAVAPNVLLIASDDVRAASLSLYGYPNPTTPELRGGAAGTYLCGAALDRPDPAIARQHVDRTLAPRAFGRSRPAAGRHLSDPGRGAGKTGLYHGRIRREYLLLQQPLRPGQGDSPAMKTITRPSTVSFFETLRSSDLAAYPSEGSRSLIHVADGETRELQTAEMTNRDAELALRNGRAIDHTSPSSLIMMCTHLMCFAVIHTLVSAWPRCCLPISFVIDRMFLDLAAGKPRAGGLHPPTASSRKRLICTATRMIAASRISIVYLVALDEIEGRGLLENTLADRDLPTMANSFLVSTAFWATV